MKLYEVTGIIRGQFNVCEDRYNEMWVYMQRREEHDWGLPQEALTDATEEVYDIPMSLGYVGYQLFTHEEAMSLQKSLTDSNPGIEVLIKEVNLPVCDAEAGVYGERHCLSFYAFLPEDDDDWHGMKARAYCIYHESEEEIVEENASSDSTD